MTKFRAEPDKWNANYATKYTALADKPVKDNPDAFKSAHVVYDKEGEEPHSERLQSMTGEMFQHFPGQVTEAFSDPSMRAHVPTLLGLATQQHQRLAGSSYALPRADESLSKHSSAMIGHLKAKGIDVPTHPGNPAAAPNNDYDLHTMATYDDPTSTKSHVSPEMVRSGRDLIRGMLRRPAVSDKQFPNAGEQGKLF